MLRHRFGVVRSDSGTAISKRAEEFVGGVREQGSAGREEVGVAVHGPKLRILGYPLRLEHAGILVLALGEVSLRRGRADLLVAFSREEAEVGQGVDLSPVVVGLLVVIEPLLGEDMMELELALDSELAVAEFETVAEVAGVENPGQDVQQRVEAGADAPAVEVLRADFKAAAPLVQLLDQTLDTACIESLDVSLDAGFGRAAVAAPHRTMQVPEQERAAARRHW